MSVLPVLPVLAAVLAGTAAVLLVPGPPGVPDVPGSAGGASRGSGGASRGVLLLALGAGALLPTLPTVDAVLAVIAAAASLAAGRLWRHAEERQEAEAQADAVLELCTALAAELRSGRPPTAALDRCARQWPVLVPVATAARLGADVPAALRAQSRRPGAAALAAMAAAWQVSGRTGAGLARAAEQVAASVRAARVRDRLVAAELASAQATARLVALLPVLVGMLGAGLGSDPRGFLLHTPAGLACLAGGLALGFGGLFWLERIGRRVLP